MNSNLKTSFCYHSTTQTDPSLSKGFILYIFTSISLMFFWTKLYSYVSLSHHFKEEIWLLHVFLENKEFFPRCFIYIKEGKKKVFVQHGMHLPQLTRNRSQRQKELEVSIMQTLHRSLHHGIGRLMINFLFWLKTRAFGGECLVYN